jgi:hypothetical protein
LLSLRSLLPVRGGRGDGGWKRMGCRGPLVNGVPGLADLSSDASVLIVPVVVLPVSQAVADMRGGCSRHADGYVIKPPDVGGVAGVAWQIAGCFWDLAQFPAR